MTIKKYKKTKKQRGGFGKIFKWVTNKKAKPINSSNNKVPNNPSNNKPPNIISSENVKKIELKLQKLDKKLDKNYELYVEIIPLETDKKTVEQLLEYKIYQDLKFNNNLENKRYKNDLYIPKNIKPTREYLLNYHLKNIKTSGYRFQNHIDIFEKLLASQKSNINILEICVYSFIIII